MGGGGEGGRKELYPVLPFRGTETARGVQEWEEHRLQGHESLELESMERA